MGHADMTGGHSSDDRARTPLMVAPPGERTRGGTLPGDLLFSAAVVALFGLLVVRVAPQLLEGALLDTDSYMRLVRAGRLAETWDWFDNTIPRSNWPFGETLHWTRPVDVLLLLGASVLAPFLGFGRALHVSGVFLSPVLLLATCFAMAWAVAPLVGRRLRYYAMIAVLAQVGIMGYALPGRADHHMLILLTTVLLTGAVVRLFMGPGEAGAGVATGVLAGAGIWVSAEFLVVVAVLLGATGVAWVVRGRDLGRRCLWLSVGMLGAVTVAVLLEQPVGRLLAVEYDRVSVVHGWVAAVATIFWAVVVRLDPDGRRMELPQRALVAVIGAVAAMVATRLVFPGFFGGPLVDVDPELERLWLANLTEFQPFLVPRSVTDVGRVVAYLGPALAVTPFLLWRVVRSRASSRWPVWVYLLAGIAVFVPLAIRWVRFAPYAEALGVVGLMALMAALLNRIDRRWSGWKKTVARVATSTALLAGFLLAGGGLMAMGGESGDGARAAVATQVGACASRGLMEALSDPRGLGAEPLALVAHVDLGPELLYRTPHLVVATPYHRNAAGILAGRRMLASRDDDESRRVADSRGVEAVLVCLAGSAAAWYDGTEPPPTLYMRLVAGDPPSWLARVTLPARARETFALYRVVDR